MSLLPRTLTQGNVVDSDSGEWPRLTLAEMIEVEASQYHHWRTPVGRLIAAELDKLAARVRRTGAQTPVDLYHRELMEEVWLQQRQLEAERLDPSL